MNNPSVLESTDTFPRRHIGPTEADVAHMLQAIGAASLDELIAQTIPENIRLKKPLNLPAALGESEALAELRTIAAKNKVQKSFIGMGYYGTITPPVILRNILENPGWYTQYTPYQAEISQGRLEALLNFQTMVSDLTALPVANASMLDEATAAAEAMHMCFATNPDRAKFFVAADCHPQTIAVVKTRAKWLGMEIIVGNPESLANPQAPDGNPGPPPSQGNAASPSHANAPDFHPGLGTEKLETRNSKLETFCGVLVQYPTTDGRIVDYSALVEAAHRAGAVVVAATDLLALTLIKPPGEWDGGGADIAVGSAQRFGVPMGYGGPHAAFMACKTEFTRKLPGRIVGISKDAHGNLAYRLALQTREQHIRREKATSNICTAQVLLAIMASMYAVYHGPEGLKAIARLVHARTHTLADSLETMGGWIIENAGGYFDTLRIRPELHQATDKVLTALKAASINARRLEDGSISISCGETTLHKDINDIVRRFAHSVNEGAAKSGKMDQIIFAGSFFATLGAKAAQSKIENRKSQFLQHPVFNSYHSETEMLRYITRLQSKDLSLAESMIPLGSCTMKLNATSEMLPVSWPEFAKLHPFAPEDQAQGYAEMFRQLESWLAEITGLDAVSLQPNAGSQGEYAGLLAIREYHAAETRNAKRETRNGGEGVGSRVEGLESEEKRVPRDPEPHTLNPVPSPRDVCLIPTSAHGTNPASAAVAGLRVVAVACDENGNVDIGDLKKKAAAHEKNLACIMITYPSTHGVFEESIRDICDIVHQHGGQVYMDGANMNAQVGLTSPGEIGADVCHLNLHKTFCIPHGGGGPGMGPIAVKKHLAPYLPGHPLAGVQAQGLQSLGFPGPVSAAPWGSASILPISWMYIRMMGEAGLKRASEVAILNANYMAKRLEPHYPILFRGKNGRCAHEFILDCRQFESSAGIKVEDIAKRLMDYGFHAPTMSSPVPGTLMFEPTESESPAELDRLCEAMIAIRNEIRQIEEGKVDRSDNPLKHAPHTAAGVCADQWPHRYSRELAAYPAPWSRALKFWPSVGRIDNPYGDRNLVCTCPPMAEL